MPPINRIAGIILAAGGSSRMGQPKQLLPCQGISLIRCAVQSAIAAELSPIVVVTSGDSAIQNEIRNLLILPAINKEWRAGMGTSVRTGMTALQNFQPVRGIMLMLADQPLVTGPILRNLIEIFSRRPSGITAAAYHDTVGVPALFGPEYFSELCSLPDAHGAKSILQRDRAFINAIPIPEAAADIDTPTAYNNLIGIIPQKPRKTEPAASARDAASHRRNKTKPQSHRVSEDAQR